MEKIDLKHDSIGTASGVNQPQSLTLYEYAKKCKHPIIEVGSLRGRSTCALARGSQDGHGVTIHAIDPWNMKPSRCLHEQDPIFKGEDTLENRVKYNMDLHRLHLKKAGCSNLVKQYPMTGAAFTFKDPIGMIFVDANKRYESMLDLWTRLWPLIVPGGFFMSHDFKWATAAATTNKEINTGIGQKFAGVKKFFDEMVFKKRGKPIAKTLIVNDMFVITKAHEISA